MEREIKFRAWDKSKMHYLEATKEKCNHILQFGVGGFWLNSYETGDLIASSGNKGVIMQYTGLKDKNGKEIYEGDVIYNTRYDKAKAKVVYKWCGFELEWITKTNLNKYLDIRHHEIEVIGNIYENPELLK